MSGPKKWLFASLPKAEKSSQVSKKCIHESDFVLVSTFGGCLGSCDEMRYDEMRRTEMKSDGMR